jgi:phenylalanyl-tRNA synthetase alpha chain
MHNSEQSEQPAQKGHIHPVTQMIQHINTIFSEMGFSVANGPEIETEFYNFDALNVPADHPARDMQDTFWLKPLTERKLLRTHTSPVQIRYMQSHKPPLRIIVPGKVFRNEATDATHEAEFYQLEGLMLDKTVSMAQLKGVLTHFFQELFGKDAEIRFRPSFFPFTEPSVEVDVLFKGKWLEVMGAGIVHPNVLRAASVDPEQWSGFAFGGGIDRLVMIKHGIDDIRLLYAGDLRLVDQF